jgi:hypothetical protein
VLGLTSVEFPVSQAARIVILNLLQYCIPSSCRCLLTNQHTKTPELQNPLFPILCEDKQTCRNVCIWSNGECNGWPVRRHEPLDITIAHFSRAWNILCPPHLSTLDRSSATVLFTSCAWECNFPSVSQRSCLRVIYFGGTCKRCSLVASRGHISDNGCLLVASQAV